jgi:hypothetical protein
LLVTGCFYLDPINRRPEVMAVERVCDAADPGSCDPILDRNDVHRGDRVMLNAVFTDRDGNEADAVLNWRIRACNVEGTLCDQLLDEAIEVPDFKVPGTLQQSGGPVQRIYVHLLVVDGRGASSVQDPTIPISDGPTLVPSRSARSLTVGAPTSWE